MGRVPLLSRKQLPPGMGAPQGGVPMGPGNAVGRAGHGTAPPIQEGSPSSWKATWHTPGPLHGVFSWKLLATPNTPKANRWDRPMGIAV